jgi:ribosomal protein S18 acetylase RimI-like enzyme
MTITIKKMETEEEIRGKALVVWRCWHDAYPGLISWEYLDALSLEKCEEVAFRWPDNIIIAKDDDRVIGFTGCGIRPDVPEIGEIFSMYVLPEYYGKGVSQQLMNARLEKLSQYDEITLWVLKENKRAIRFYRKCGFVPDGSEMMDTRLKAVEIRMVYRRS